MYLGLFGYFTEENRKPGEGGYFFSGDILKNTPPPPGISAIAIKGGDKFEKGGKGKR